MLDNDPPPGTKVRFVRQVRTARVNDIGTLQPTLRKYSVERPNDEFEVEIHGERVTVQRQDIERIR
jgi:hypothetical protein